MDRERAKKIEMILSLANCGMREGLDEKQKTALSDFRRNLLVALIDEKPIANPLADLANFYVSIQHVSGLGCVLFPQETARHDLVRLREGIEKYKPDHGDLAVPSAGLHCV
ncbi:MAG: hypothetical protein P4M13_11840 [Alphaproteobacteria bacterium]|nr:hypothetical protein [Alphaproteobacteria bacterium]